MMHLETQTGENWQRSQSTICLCSFFKMWPPKQRWEGVQRWQMGKHESNKPLSGSDKSIVSNRPPRSVHLTNMLLSASENGRMLTLGSISVRKPCRVGKGQQRNIKGAPGSRMYNSQAPAAEVGRKNLQVSLQDYLPFENQLSLSSRLI